MLLGGDRLQDELFVTVRFRADDDGVNGGVVPDVFWKFRDGGAELVGGHFCAIRVVVPNFCDFDVLSGGHPLDEIRGVDVAATDECQCFHVGLLFWGVKKLDILDVLDVLDVLDTLVSICFKL